MRADAAARRADLGWALLIAGYFAVQLAARLLTGPALELDEAEAFYHARELRWGYGPQPPLYWWLQWAVFQAAGETLAALALLKALLLAGTLLGLYAFLRREHTPGQAGAATLALGLLPQVAWESQRALANSVLALALAVAVAWLFVRALELGRWRDHLLLGVAVGLIVLAKLNAALWPLGLLLGALALPEWRARLRPGRLLAALAVAGLTVLPVGLWTFRNLELATGSLGKLAIEDGGALGARLAGTGSLLLAGLSFSALAGVALGGAALRWGRAPLAPTARLLAAGAAAALAALWLGLLLGGATAVKDRWLLPFLWPVAPVAALAVWPRLGPRARRALLGAAGGAWLLAAALLPYGNLVDPGYRGADFAPLAQRLAATDRPLVVGPLWVAGNLARERPGLAPAYWDEATALPDAPATLVLEEGDARLRDPAVAARTEAVEPIEVRRGGRAMGLLIVALGPKA